jgi:hypothetical protein
MATAASLTGRPGPHTTGISRPDSHSGARQAPWAAPARGTRRTALPWAHWHASMHAHKPLSHRFLGEAETANCSSGGVERMRSSSPDSDCDKPSESDALDTDGEVEGKYGLCDSVDLSATAA